MKTLQKISTILVTLFLASHIDAARLKDLASIQGGRDNQLVGYSLVMGLAGDGDSSSEITVRSVVNSMKRFGMSIDPELLSNIDNVAAVIVTADIPPFARKGTRIDITVASMGDAESLQGGILIQTPLVGADNEVYAVAQGAISVGGFLGGAAGPGGATIQKNHPTVGMIPNGAIVEKEIPMDIVDQGFLHWVLRSPDFATASRMAEAINLKFPSSAVAMDAAAIQVAIPEMYDGREVDFITELGTINLSPDTPARVVYNEKTGTIVFTSEVRISTVAVSHGALTITIANNLNVSQPGAFAEGGETAVTPATTAEVEEVMGGFKLVEEFPTISEVNTALNSLGVSTREMMSIFQAMKTAGALQAELISM